jgi:hypothetical protein
MLECADVGGATAAPEVALHFELDPAVPGREFGCDVCKLKRSGPLAVDCGDVALIH